MGKWIFQGGGGKKSEAILQKVKIDIYVVNEAAMG
jgi:hypothetical protein